MTEESATNWFDPRLTVFIIWGIFVFFFLCIPSKRFVARILRRLGCPCTCLEEEEPRVVPFSRDDVDYEYLTNERKHEIDSLRSIAILRHLNNYTLTLKQENMVRRLLSKYNSPSTIEEIESDICEIPLGREEPHSSLNDVENGNNDKSKRDTPWTEDETKEVDEQIRDTLRDALGDTVCEYTHIAIPQPGHEEHCTVVSEPLSSNSTHDEKKKSKRRLTISVKKTVTLEEMEERKQAKAKAETAVAVKKVDGMDDKRNVPIFCAICLTEYKVGERVCWSSNPQCTHAFHEHCVVRWFISLGRTKSKMQRFSLNPSERQLLNYELECPCCRQEFICKAATPEDGEEHV